MIPFKNIYTKNIIKKAVCKMKDKNKSLIGTILLFCILLLITYFTAPDNEVMLLLALVIVVDTIRLVYDKIRKK